MKRGVGDVKKHELLPSETEVRKRIRLKCGFSRLSKILLISDWKFNGNKKVINVLKPIKWSAEF